MMELFETYKSAGNIENALTVGRNLFNRNPSNVEIFTAYFDFLTYLAEKLPALEERKNYANQAEIAAAFFTENAEISESIVEKINACDSKITNIKKQISDIEQERERDALKQTAEKNQAAIKQLYELKNELQAVKDQKTFDEKLQAIHELDSSIDKDSLNKEQDKHYNGLTKEFTALISEKMREFEYQRNIEYNKQAVNSYQRAFDAFRKDENKYKDEGQLYDLASKILFAYDASKLFNETLIYYNHVYAYIFGKLDDTGKFELTRYSIECERKLRY